MTIDRRSTRTDSIRLLRQRGGATLNDLQRATEVEGFRQAIPKIEVAADPAELRCPPEELLAVVSPVAGQADVPWFRPSDLDAITDLIVSRVVDPAKRLLLRFSIGS